MVENTSKQKENPIFLLTNTIPYSVPTRLHSSVKINAQSAFFSCSRARLLPISFPEPAILGKETKALG
jgi:hypothetical protein